MEAIETGEMEVLTGGNVGRIVKDFRYTIGGAIVEIVTSVS